MPSFDDVIAGRPALASDVQQVIDALTGRRNTPLTTIVNDTLAFAYSARNNDASGRLVQLLAPDGTTVLFQVDAGGVLVSRDGAPAVAPLTSVGSGTAPQVAAGNHVHGAGGYSSAGSTTLEALYASTTVVTGTNYGSAGGFGAGIMFVFCTAGVTVTLPAAGPTNRPITVAAITGSTTVASSGGSVIGGSFNTSTGLIMNGVISPGDSVTYKSDGTNWRAV